MNTPLRTGVAIPLILLCVLLLAACERGDSLQQIRQKGELSVISRNGPATYFQDKNGPTGFEYALAQRFADHLGVELRMHSAFSLDDLFARLLRGEVHFAAAGLTITGDREDHFLLSEPYMSAVPQVVYVAGTRKPRTIEDMLDMRLVVLAGSSHAGSLAALQASGYPDLQWLELDGIDTMDLLEMVDEGEAELAIIDSIEFAVQQSLFPRLRVAFNLGSEQQLAWFLPGTGDHQRLLAEINQFFSRLASDGTMERLRELHFGHTDDVSRIGSHTFSRKMRRTLPRYRDMIKQVAAEYQLDWHLLAAIAYQESHWNPTATSATGVRGMMMLTLPTAEEMGVKNRLDPVASLRGGARYLKNIKRRLPADIHEPDRTWFALAAYNVGMGHLEDARVLTERQGGDPHLCSEVMQRLPLLQQSKYYKTVRYGYARGREPVEYVQNIRHYYNILQWQDIALDQPQAPIDVTPLLPAVLGGSSLQAL
jgi:membrane-bound lytic murein transglycosylase F